MAIAPLQLQGFSQINNSVDPSQWSTLANLGNVYRDAQAAAAKRAALASLGTDEPTNIKTLLTSGDPQLAQLGLNLQEKGIDRSREDVRYGVTDKRADAQLAIQQAAARRAQGTYDEAEADRRNAPALIAGMFGGQSPQQAPQAAPFPAPLPGAQPVPQVPQQAEPSAAFQGTPILPTGLQPPPQSPPVKAEGADPVPDWVQSAQAQPPDTSIVGRVTSNLASEHPTAAAGISRDQLGALYANPVTRPLATAFLQKQLDPGTYSFQNVGNNLVRTNSKTGVSDVVMTDTKPISVKEGEQMLVPDKTSPTGYRDISGGAGQSKQEREVQGYFAAGKGLGMSDQDATAFAANKGKTPKEDLSPGEKTEINKKTDVVSNGQNVIDNIQTLKDLSKNAYSGWGALPRAQAQNILPDWLQSQRSLDTQELTNIAHQNVAQQAKATFGARITNLDLQLLKELETSADQPDALRQKIYVRVEKMLQGKVDEARTEVEGIRNKTYYKPGGGAPAAAKPGGGPVDYQTYFSGG